MNADDISIAYSSSSLADIKRTLHSELSVLKQWLQGNNLSLNVLKTEALVAGSHPKVPKITDKAVDDPKDECNKIIRKNRKDSPISTHYFYNQVSLFFAMRFSKKRMCK